MKSDYLWHALQMLKDPKVLEAIASISTTPKPNVPVDHWQTELENLKHEEDKKNFLMPQVAPSRHQQINSYDEMCLEFSSPKS